MSAFNFALVKLAETKAKSIESTVMDAVTVPGVVWMQVLDEQVAT
jgi:hypothetical protein